MHKKLLDTLREIQSKPATGTTHNHHLISTQVESIIATDDLSQKIEKLSKTILSLDNQSLKLEKSNIKLQWIMVILTVATVLLSILTFVKE